MFRALLDGHCIHALMIDIDKMSQLNMRIGFDQGDIVLKHISNKLKRVLGDDYNLYKYNTDTFIVLAKHTYCKSEVTHFGSQEIEQRILTPDNYSIELEHETLALSASIGSAIFDPNKQSFENVLDILEHTVEQAKLNAPFGLYHVTEQGIDEYDRYMSIQTLLKTVVNRDELSLVMQPQYTNEGKLNSFEALLRWHSNEFGWVSPADFIPLAEKSSSIIKIGDWVLLTACKAIQELLNKGLTTSISVNISAKQIIATDFTSKLVKLVRRLNIPPKMLVLELTETALVIDITLVKRTMTELGEHGFRFSIDDFGTGYSSLAYLKELPISELKIDKYFVDDLEVQKKQKPSAIVDAIIDMAKALGVKSVAEGVETKAQYEYLKNKGCDIYQGYYFAKPIGMTAWRALIAEECKEK